ncbi:MAG TPA: hypothetical protein VER55_00520 [Ardenticatenaceae bacterium]|nr:hypothetical protein [Ardenticatenaceae bacterium]
MDTTQATQMLTWLDEAHRRDRALLVDLRQKVDSQTVEISDQAKRVQELEGRLASTQARLAKFTQLEQSLQQLKDELVLMIRQQEDEHIKADREQVKLRQIERENLARAISELRRGLEPIAPLQERITLLKAEDQRLGEQVLDLQARVTAYHHEVAQLPDRITYLEAQRPQEQKAIVQVQQELVELFRRTEGYTTKLSLIEEIARRNEQGLSALVSLRDDLKREQARLVEELRLKEDSRDRQMAEWSAEINRYTEAIHKQSRQLEQYSKQTEMTQQNLMGIEKFREQITRELRQAAEVQRMAEARQREEMQAYRAETEQRWNKTQLETDARWHQQAGRNEEVAQRVTTLEGLRREDAERMQQLAKELLAIQQEFRAKLVELWRIQERAAAFRVDEVRYWYDEVAELVREKVSE